MNTYLHIFFRYLIIPGISSLVFIQSAFAENPPDIVVTLKPLHSLVSAITKDITTPQLLLNTTQSPHHTYLRPSDYRKIANADIVFWANESMEAFMPALEKQYDQSTIFVSLMQADGIKRLNTRHQHDQSHLAYESNHQSLDPHFWLSTHNAKQIIKAITKQLIRIDTQNKKQYLENQTAALQRIEALHAYLSGLFKSSLPPFISYHDAYQYFEDDFHLNRLASVSLNEDISPSIKRIRLIKDLIHMHHITCIVYDAPTKPPVLNTLVDDSKISVVELDPLGITLPAGDSLWFDTIKTLGENIAQCLKTQKNTSY